MGHNDTIDYGPYNYNDLETTYLAADERFFRGIITTPTSDVVICDSLKRGSIWTILLYGQSEAGSLTHFFNINEQNLDDCVDRFGIELAGVT